MPPFLRPLGLLRRLTLQVPFLWLFRMTAYFQLSTFTFQLSPFHLLPFTFQLVNSSTMKKILLILFVLCWTCTSFSSVYTIYPVPQQQVSLSGVAQMRGPVCLVAERGIDAATVARAEQILSDYGVKTVLTSQPQKGVTNVLLGTNGSREVADKLVTRLHLSREVFTRPKYDRHVLHLYGDKLGTAQIVILGENTDATFCGLASLEQMLEAYPLAGQKPLPCVTLYDYADIRDRGIIEGYYGVPYSAEVTKDLFRFMARYKMNTYMYGAKSDPYHSQRWADPYPTSITPEQLRIGYLTQDMLRDITSVGHATKVNFIWAIHPGTAFTDAGNNQVLSQIMQKFSDMHRLGVRQFGVFVDDVGVPNDDATLRLGAERLTELQQRIDERWNQAGATPADTVKPLHYVPQLYAYSWVQTQQAQRFFNALSTVPQKVRIYITGRAVWTVPNSTDLTIVQQWLGHDTSWWWNYPCNDNDVTKLFTMDTYANFHDEQHINTLARLEPELQGTPTLIINPMQQGEISKIALFSVADYAWNNAGFNNHRSWEAALPAVVGEEKAAALRILAPYLRYFDADALAYEVRNYRRSVADGHPRPGAVIGLLRRVLTACQTLETLSSSDKESDRLFYEDLRPWLLKLKAMAGETIDRLEGKQTVAVDLDSNPAFQFPILTGLGNSINLSVKTAEPAAEVLQPLLLWLREQ